jgi:hypothetical protein
MQPRESKLKRIRSFWLKILLNLARLTIQNLI